MLDSWDQPVAQIHCKQPPKCWVETYKIGSRQVLSLGKVGPIEMRQLARGHIDERPPIMVRYRHRRIIKGYGYIFVVVALSLAFLLATRGYFVGLIIISIFGAT